MYYVHYNFVNIHLKRKANEKVLILRYNYIKTKIKKTHDTVNR